MTSELLTGNIFGDVSVREDAEIFTNLINNKHIKVERIISHGHKSPDDFWYDQNKDEWVIVLQGAARLLFEDGNEVVMLSVGDYINIPAHKRHKVEWTSPDTATIWMVIFYCTDD